MSRPTRYAVVGHPVDHSRSPEIQLAFAHQFGLELTYERIDAPPERFDRCVHDFFAGGGAGLNVTVPHKASAYLLCRSVSPRAALAGVVNTLWQERGLTHGDNTDGIGLLRDLERLAAEQRRSLFGASVLLLGAGGAARGALAGLLDLELSKFVIVARDPAKADALKSQFQRHEHVRVKRLDEQASQDKFDIVINATSAGLNDSAPQVQDLWFSQCWLAYDLSYSASAIPDTAFLRHARSLGVAVVCDGLGMLIEQAAEAFHVWHGLRPDVEPVLKKMRAP